MNIQLITVPLSISKTHSSTISAFRLNLGHYSVLVIVLGTLPLDHWEHMVSCKNIMNKKEDFCYLIKVEI